ncbi:hypothetical protein PROPHIGD39-2_25 [Mycobacterium phage prophiGD39-2]|uniref:hypothetical protein n=1 Tax=Mycobacteroides abscessus TaxID=36809 RepID=UPI0006820EF4|nr:hypothetical protein [Mycobacteroides abscessus]QPO17298.1 hypothetical protein PHIGD57-1_59 [Mycobacterium phage phiGD57-1]QST88880.1 hypothetical protein PROPHIGD57-1_25 [Mycobacterium phage prophiGD25-1]QST89142.1 hypothetical protein PROPHIGD39-2_25 [Mycobacterium phage prophiGD39-2]QST89686.1 hypothetical protein PROPHIGD57-1_25 [Mycobacterium phage prophi57-1]KNB64087.1 hypothetical protein MAUC95_22020 [Mycobacteroides abscessus]
MTQETDPERFTCPGLEEGDRVAIQFADGTLAEGYWYDGAVHDEPLKPSRPPAPWRICKRDGEWRIEKRLTDGYEAWCRFDTSTEAFAAFAAGGAR